jgi:ribosome-associated toxin RatA of RatAB toxin-antitoxin module
MPKFEFTAKIPSSPEKLLEKLSLYEEYPKYFQYLTSVKILKQNNNETTTEEKLEFNYHKLHHKISQQTITTINNSKIESKVISGPLKNTFVKTNLEENEIGTKVSVNTDLHIGLKYKFLSPIITKRIKMATIAVLFKMHTAIEEKNK